VQIPLALLWSVTAGSVRLFRETQTLRQRVRELEKPSR
jgi:hypothetical protein